MTERDWRPGAAEKSFRLRKTFGGFFNKQIEGKPFAVFGECLWSPAIEKLHPNLFSGEEGPVSVLLGMDRRSFSQFIKSVKEDKRLTSNTWVEEEGISVRSWTLRREHHIARCEDFIQRLTIQEPFAHLSVWSLEMGTLNWTKAFQENVENNPKEIVLNPHVVENLLGEYEDPGKKAREIEEFFQQVRDQKSLTGASIQERGLNDIERIRERWDDIKRKILPAS